jgi:predicted HicB family RNase H-like nuclease
MKKILVSIPIDQELHNKIRNSASNNEQSMAGFIRFTLKEKVNEDIKNDK